MYNMIRGITMQYTAEQLNDPHLFDGPEHDKAKAESYQRALNLHNAVKRSKKTGRIVRRRSRH